MQFTGNLCCCFVQRKLIPNLCPRFGHFRVSIFDNSYFLVLIFGAFPFYTHNISSPCEYYKQIKDHRNLNNHPRTDYNTYNQCHKWEFSQYPSI